MEFTKEQQKEIDELRKRVGHCLCEYFKPDYELVRFLRGRNWDIDKAEAMCLKTMEWRKSWGIDNLLSWKAPEVLQKYYPYGFVGYDKEGCPVWLSPEGGQNMRGILQSCTQRDYVLYTLQIVETSLKKMKEQTASLGKNITSHSLIYDLEHFSLFVTTWKPAKHLVEEMAQLYTSYYPEFLKTAYLINAPKVFTLAYALVKPFLDEGTAKKIRIFGKSGWKDAILESIPADTLPKYLGGTRCDPDGDPMCKSIINYGGEVPKSYYLTKKKRLGQESAKDDGRYKVAVIPHGGKETFEYDVKEAGSQIRWEFQTEDYDIGFGITRVRSGQEDILVIPHRVNSQLSPEEGCLICTEPGKYIITFNNEFSYMRSKRLLYSIQLLLPKDLETTKL